MKDESLKPLLKLVDRMASKVYQKTGKRLDIDDLKGAGYEGLAACLYTFDADKNTKISTFARYRVVGSIFDSIRKEDALGRSRRDDINLIEAKKEEMTQRLSRSVSELEACRELGISDKRYYYLQSQALLASASHLDQDFDDMVDMSNVVLLSLIGGGKSSQEKDFLEKEDRDAVMLMLDKLSENEKAVIMGHYYEGKILTEVSEDMGLSLARVSVIHQNALAKLKKHMVRSEFTKDRECA